jgi:hypothetical protein
MQCIMYNKTKDKTELNNCRETAMRRRDVRASNNVPSVRWLHAGLPRVHSRRAAAGEALQEDPGHHHHFTRVLGAGYA